MLVFVVAGVGCGAAGAVLAISQLQVQPAAVFSVQWTAIMAFVVIIGGLGTIEGPILGTIVYIVLQQTLASYNAWYLIILGLVAIVIALFARRGLWGLVDDYLHIRLFPVGYWLWTPETQKPPSRGDAAIAMNRWLEILRSGTDPPLVAPSLNKRSPPSCLSISSGRPKKPRGWGDSRWTQVMNHYYAAVRRELKALRGKEVVTTGNGLLATFGAPAPGVRCAIAIREAVRTLGLEIRVGLHAGEYKVSGAEVFGLAFHIGARVAAKAGAGEVLVSSAVKDLMSQSAIRFKDRGVHQLRGVPKRWRLYRVEH